MIDSFMLNALYHLHLAWTGYQTGNTLRALGHADSCFSVEMCTLFARCAATKHGCNTSANRSGENGSPCSRPCLLMHLNEECRPDLVRNRESVSRNKRAYVRVNADLLVGSSWIAVCTAALETVLKALAMSMVPSVMPGCSSHQRRNRVVNELGTGLHPNSYLHRGKFFRELHLLRGNDGS